MQVHLVHMSAELVDLMHASAARVHASALKGFKLTRTRQIIE